MTATTPPPADGAPYDVAVVGYGPVGSVLGNLLAMRGHRVVVFDREPGVHHLPRAAHFDGEIMRVFQHLGITEAIEPAITVGEGMDFVNAAGTRLFGFAARARPARDGWPQSFMFFQPELEAALRTAGAALPTLTACLEHEVERVRDAGDHVAVEVRDIRTGARRTVRARYAVGCDGARSLVRQALAVALEDLRCDQPWLVVDVLLRRPVDLPTVAVQHCDPDRPATFVPMPGRRRRVEIMCMPGDDLESMPQRTPDFLARWFPDPAADVEIERAAVYTFHALIASPWRRGRVMLAGDSAHQMPPFLGQGMCSGIRDAVNLEWKLDAVLRGAAADALLDTYEAERSPHVRAVIDLAVAAGGVIQTTDPAVAAARDAHFLAGGALGPGDGPGEMPPIGPGLLHGPPGDVVGMRLPQPAPGFDQRLGDGFAIVARDMPPATALVGRARLRGITVTAVAAPELTEWLDRHDLWGVVVRPDRHVYARLASAGECDEVLAGLASALHPDAGPG